MIATELNSLMHQLTGHPPTDPIDVVRAEQDPSYDQCIDSYNIVAGAPANFHRAPRIYEVDAVKVGGPFTDPNTLLGYPNYSFFIPGEYWMPGVLQKMQQLMLWLQQQPRFKSYGVLVHPNTGCEVRDHVEPRSVLWLGTELPMFASIFRCRLLGCNQACRPSVQVQPPGSCSH